MKRKGERGKAIAAKKLDLAVDMYNEGRDPAAIALVAEAPYRTVQRFGTGMLSGTFGVFRCLGTIVKYLSYSKFNFTSEIFVRAIFFGSRCS